MTSSIKVHLNFSSIQIYLLKSLNIHQQIWSFLLLCKISRHHRSLTPSKSMSKTAIMILRKNIIMFVLVQLNPCILNHGCWHITTLFKIHLKVRCTLMFLDGGQAFCSWKWAIFVSQGAFVIQLRLKFLVTSFSSRELTWTLVRSLILDQIHKCN